MGKDTIEMNEAEGNSTTLSRISRRKEEDVTGARVQGALRSTLRLACAAWAAV
jgi:hypothetical protein